MQKCKNEVDEGNEDNEGEVNGVFLTVPVLF
jgi:hypothetical protein